LATFGFITEAKAFRQRPRLLTVVNDRLNPALTPSASPVGSRVKTLYAGELCYAPLLLSRILSMAANSYYPDWNAGEVAAVTGIRLVSKACKANL
jgi:hypothetical protein